MATRRVAPYTLSTPPKPTPGSRKASVDLSQLEGMDSMAIGGDKMAEDDVEMHSAHGSDGWETQDSTWDEERKLVDQSYISELISSLFSQTKCRDRPLRRPFRHPTSSTVFSIVAHSAFQVLPCSSKVWSLGSFIALLAKLVLQASNSSPTSLAQHLHSSPQPFP